jgi:hypothetical protein
VFDIQTAITDVTGIVWRYGTGGLGADPTLWQSFAAWGTDVLDNTNADGAHTGVAFDTTGIRSVHWEQDITFTAVNPQVGAGVALGVTGYWVCAHVTAIGVVGPTAPIQQNRGIYSILWPYVEIDDEQLGGDLPAVPRFILRNESDGGLSSPGVDSPELWHSKIIMGLRSLTRKGVDCSDFSAFLNCTDNAQNPAGVTYNGGGGMVADNQSATGRSYRQAAAGNTGTAGIFTIDAVYAAQYYGNYHAYLICTQENNLAGDIEFALNIWNIGEPLTYLTTNYSPTEAVGNNLIVDIGRISLGAPASLLGTELADLVIQIAYNSDVALGLSFRMHSLVLIPTDEWACESYIPDTSLTSYQASIGRRGDASGGGTEDPRYLMIDGYGVPKVTMRSLAFYEDTGQILSLWNVFGTPPRITPNTTQRVWTLSGRGDFAVLPLYYIADPEMVLSFEILAQQRYSSMRGNG